jgi:RNA polymerase sigma-70 factor, ECF subfamily
MRAGYEFDDGWKGRSCVLNRPEQSPHAKINLAEMSDEDLILLVQEGNNQAFDALVGRYKNRLYTYLYRLLGNADEAEELAQEAFVKAYVHADKYRTVARFSTWLYTIATNLVRNRIRNIKRRPAMVSLWSDDSEGQDDGRWLDLKDDSQRPDATLERKDLSELIQCAIEKIPVKYRPPFVLREINELSYEEIAAVTGLKLGTVRSRINRGRAHFKRIVAPLLAKDYNMNGNGS